MKKVFIVTSGSYSDYGIDGVFDTEELAQKFIDSFTECYDGMRVEEWILNPLEKEIRDDRKACFIRINKQGDVKDFEFCDSSSGFKNGSGYSFTYDGEWMNIFCFAKDKEHTIKIAGERRTQYLAEKEWGE